MNIESVLINPHGEDRLGSLIGEKQVIKLIGFVFASLFVVGLVGCKRDEPPGFTRAEMTIARTPASQGWNGIDDFVELSSAHGDGEHDWAYVKDRKHEICYFVEMTGNYRGSTRLRSWATVPCEKVEPQKTATTAAPSALAH